jgi:hypothetical protein
MSLAGSAFGIGRWRLAWLAEDAVSLLVHTGADKGEMLMEPSQGRSPP